AGGAVLLAHRGGAGGGGGPRPWPGWPQNPPPRPPPRPKRGRSPFPPPGGGPAPAGQTTTGPGRGAPPPGAFGPPARDPRARREGLYSSHIVEWRRARDAGALAGVADKPRTPARSQAERGVDHFVDRGSVSAPWQIRPQRHRAAHPGLGAFRHRRPDPGAARG